MKIFCRVGAAVVIASMFGFAPMSANASTVLYDFTVHVTSGPLAPETLNGSFGFDSSSIIPGGSGAVTLTEFNFTFDGVTSDTSNTNASFGWDLSGVLVSTYISGPNWIDKGGGFIYKITSDYGVGGDVTYSLAGAPEPAIWAMLLAGFFGIGAMARHLRRSVSATG